MTTPYIPSLLASTGRFCEWSVKPTPGGRPTKVPDMGNNLALCRPWEAVQHVERTRERGVGVYFWKGIKTQFADGSAAQLIGIDLDACVNKQTGEITPWAKEIIEKLGNPFTEYSPSGGGLHIYVLVRAEQLEGLKAHGYVPHAAIGDDKKADLQLFTNYGYMTMTLHHVAGTATEITSTDLKWLIEKYDLRGEFAGDAELPTGEGTAPATDEIRTGVARRKHGPELLIADWEPVLPEKSASEAFQMLEIMVLDAARNHGLAALRFLLHETAWGKGDVENSRDPGKYSRESWVKKDLARIAGKKAANGRAAVGMFPVVATQPKPTPKPTPKPLTLSSGFDKIFDEWRKEGPLVHLPTGFPSLDAATGGGFVLGSRVFLNGAPDAWKTGLGVQLIDNYLRQGIPCAILGVDEEPGDLTMRFLQRRGLSRAECEARAPETLEKGKQLLAGLPVILFDGSVTIEEAAEQLAELARQRFPGVEHPPCVLLIDSIQVARARDENWNDSLYKLVTQRVAVIRALATKFRMLMIMTSEMSRAAYKHRRDQDQTADMAAAKESGAIEYSARVMVNLKSVPGSSDTVEARLAKNKHGRSHRADQEGIYLRTDRERQTLVEDSTFEPIDVKETKKAGEEAMRKLTDAVKLCRAILMVEREQPLEGTRDICAAAGLKYAQYVEVRAWLKELGALKIVPGLRGAERLVIEEARLPDAMREQMLL